MSDRSSDTRARVAWLLVGVWLGAAAAVAVTCFVLGRPAMGVAAVVLGLAAPVMVRYRRLELTPRTPTGPKLLR